MSERLSLTIATPDGLTIGADGIAVELSWSVANARAPRCEVLLPEGEQTIAADGQKRVANTGADLSNPIAWIDASLPHPRRVQAVVIAWSPVDDSDDRIVRLHCYRSAEQPQPCLSVDLGQPTADPTTYYIAPTIAQRLRVEVVTKDASVPHSYLASSACLSSLDIIVARAPAGLAVRIDGGPPRFLSETVPGGRATIPGLAQYLDDRRSSLPMHLEAAVGGALDVDAIQGSVLPLAEHTTFADGQDTLVVPLDGVGAPTVELTLTGARLIEELALDLQANLSAWHERSLPVGDVVDPRHEQRIDAQTQLAVPLDGWGEAPLLAVCVETVASFDTAFVAVATWHADADGRPVTAPLAEGEVMVEDGLVIATPASPLASSSGRTWVVLAPSSGSVRLRLYKAAQAPGLLVRARGGEWRPRRVPHHEAADDTATVRATLRLQAARPASVRLEWGVGELLAEGSRWRLEDTPLAHDGPIILQIYSEFPGSVSLSGLMVRHVAREGA